MNASKYVVHVRNQNIRYQPYSYLIKNDLIHEERDFTKIILMYY